MTPFFHPYPYGIMAKVWLFFCFLYGFAILPAFLYGMEQSYQPGLISTLINTLILYYFGLLIGRLVKKVIKKFIPQAIKRDL
jgi:tetrahydromethanopterin S-methyltransferase subunit C